jgi:hypothetical protein
VILKFFRRLTPYCVILAGITALACSGSGDTDDVLEAEAREKALRVAALITAYNPKNAQEQFETAAEYFSDKGRERYIKGLLAAQLPAILATEREQDWKPAEDEVLVAWDGSEHLEVSLHGIRTRVDKNGIMPEETIRYTFQVVTDEHGTLLFDALLTQTPGASEAELLKQWEQVSGDATLERDNFRKVVEQVDKDLKAHEVQVDKSFEKLNSSLGELQNRVKDIGVEVKRQKAREVEALRAIEQSKNDSEKVEPSVLEGGGEEIPKVADGTSTAGSSSELRE